MAVPRWLQPLFYQDRRLLLSAWTFAILMLIVIGMSWGMGGRASWVDGWVAICTLGGIMGVIFLRRTTTSEQAWSLPIGPPLWVWLPWTLLGIQITVALLNPAYEVLTLPDGKELLYAVNHVEVLPSAIDARRTAEHGLRLLWAALLLSCVLYGLPSTRWQRYLLTGLVAHALLLALVGTYYKLTGATTILGRFEAPNESFFATYRYHNQWGAFAILHIGMAMGLVVLLREKCGPLSRKENSAIFWLATLPLIALTIPLCSGRASMIALGGFILAGSAFLIYQGGLLPSNSANHTRRKPLLIALGVFCLLIAAATLYVAGDTLRPRWFASVEEIAGGFQSGSLTTRLAASRITVDMIAERPLWGWGLGSFVHVFPFFAGDKFYPGEDWVMQFAHNDWLQYLAELGVFGTFCLLATPFFLALHYRSTHCSARVWLWIALGCLGIVALLDFPLANPSIQILAAITFAIGLRLRNSKITNSSKTDS